MSFQMGSQKKKTTETSTVKPYEPTIPLINDFLTGLPKASEAGPTAGQVDAFGQLKDIAKQGDPNAGKIASNASDALGYKLTSTAPIAEKGYADYTRRMSAVADGKNQDLGNDPFLQQLLTQVGDEAANRNRAVFAAAGRDGSGYDQQTTARGVTQAQLPVLVDQLNRERARTDTAAGNLYNAGNTTANTVLDLNKTADGATADMHAKGVDMNKAAIDSKAWGPTQILNLEQQMKGMKTDDLAKIAELLFPAAKLGQQSTGTSKSKGTSVGFGLKLI